MEFVHTQLSIPNHMNNLPSICLAIEKKDDELCFACINEQK